MLTIYNKIVTVFLALIVLVSTSGLSITEHFCRHCGFSIQIFQQHSCSTGDTKLSGTGKCKTNKTSPFKIHKPKCCVSEKITLKTSAFHTSTIAKIKIQPSEICKKIIIHEIVLENFTKIFPIQNNSPPSYSQTGYYVQYCSFLI